MIRVCVVLLTLLLLCSCVEALWTDLTDAELALDPFAAYYQWRGPSGPEERNDTSLLTARFSSQSPCKALTIRDNCFSHNPKRANALLRRTFALKFNSTDLNPTTVLSALKNQVIVFLGDSTVVAAYASLVCHFSQFADVKYSLMWLYKEDFILTDEKKQDKCPGHPSCYLLNGESRIASHNITFYYQQLNSYRGREKQTFVRMVEGTSVVPTVAIVNFGVHYNHERPYMHELQVFKNDMMNLFERQRAAGTPVAQWLWLESFPQHFPGRGYFDPNAPHSRNVSAASGGLMCEPIQDKKHFFDEDWRNRYVEMFLPEFHRSGRLIRIAEPLYDQWDAHVDYGDSFRAKEHMDCTHYCLGSGVFRFVIDSILASTLTCLRGQCADNHFFDGV